MSDHKLYNIAVIGASGYTGADLIRLAVRHPNITVKALVANTHAGKPVDQVFPHLGGVGLPDLVSPEEVDWHDIDAAFCGLPHGTAHQIISELPDTLKVIDMSADFRLRDPETYALWYGGEHGASDLLKTAVYGLTEHYAGDIAQARLVACPGCYPTRSANRAPTFGLRTAYRCERSHYRRQIRCIGRWAELEAEHAVLRSRRRIDALCRCRPSSRAGNRARAVAGGRR